MSWAGLAVGGGRPDRPRRASGAQHHPVRRDRGLRRLRRSAGDPHHAAGLRSGGRGHHGGRPVADPSSPGRSWGRPLVDLVLALGAGPGPRCSADPARTAGAVGLDPEQRSPAGPDRRWAESLPPHDLYHLLVQGYNGLPIAGSPVFGDTVYFDTAAYVGVVALALAVLGLVRRRRRPEVAALVVLAVVTTGRRLPAAGRGGVPASAGLPDHRLAPRTDGAGAVPGGAGRCGADVVVRRATDRPGLLGGSWPAARLLLVVLSCSAPRGCPPVDAALRRRSLLWPLITTAPPWSRWGCWPSGRRRRPGPPGRHHGAAPEGRWPRPSPGRWSAVFSSCWRRSFSSPPARRCGPRPPTASVVSPRCRPWSAVVGGAKVGFGSIPASRAPATALGLLPEANILFGVHEFDFYDPILPRAYFGGLDGREPDPGRRAHLQLVLPAARHGGPGPPVRGGLRARPPGRPRARRRGRSRGTFGDEALYRIPGSSAATLAPVPGPASSRRPDRGEPGGRHPSVPASWR